MTESEWLNCTEPEKMLDILRSNASERKLQLFEVACRRRIWHVLADGWNTNNLLSGRAAEFAVRALDNPVDRLTQCHLLHDIFGNPFHLVTISPTVLAWNDATVVRLAQAAYDERHLPENTLDNERLAVLADALEEAGCTSEEILGHLRGPDPHVRGCWPVDLCLGKS